MDFATFQNECDVPRETFSRLQTYVLLLEKWQKSINLISPKTLNEIWQRHVLDGLQILKHIPDSISHQTQFIDLGSGAGIPGALIGLVLDNPIALIESDSRKCTFLETVSRETNRPNIRVVCARAEETVIHNAELCFSRALAPLDTLLSYSFVQKDKNITCFFHKGAQHTEELKDAKKFWNFTAEIFPSITQEGSVILKLTDIEPRQ